MPDKNNSNSKQTGSSLGLDENVAGALSYFLGVFTGVLFLLLEEKSNFVKFHAMQSSILFIGVFVLNWVLGFIPVLSLILVPLVVLATVILWILLMMKAYQNEKFKLPVVGDIAEKKVENLDN